MALPILPPDQDQANELQLFGNILNYQPSKRAKIDDPNFGVAINHTNAFLNKLMKGQVLPASSSIKLSELTDSVSVTKATLERGMAFAKELEKQSKLITDKDAELREQERIKAQAEQTVVPPLSPLASLGSKKLNDASASLTKQLKELESAKARAEQAIKLSKKIIKDSDLELGSKKSKPVDKELTKLHQEVLSNLADQVIKDFDTHQRVLIPLTSQIKDSQNATMLCEFRKQKDGEILFLVWNIGIGVTEHLSKDDSEQFKRFAPVRVFRCANDKNINKESLKVFIKKCLEPSLPTLIKEEEINPSQYYSHIIGQVSYISGEEIDSAPYYHTDSIAQPEGSSAWKVVETFLQNTAIKKENFNEVQYEILKDAFETVLNKYNVFIKKSPDFKQAIDEVTGLFAIKLQQLSKEKQFSADRVKTGLDLILRAKKLINEKSTVVPEIDVQKQSEFQVPKSQPIKIDLEWDRWIDFSQKSALPTKEEEKQDIIVESVPALKNLDDANAFMEKLLAKSIKDAAKDLDPLTNPSIWNDQYQTRKDNRKAEKIRTIKEFEALLKSLPLTDEFINAPHKVAIHDFALTLQNSINCYLNACKSLDEVPFGDRQIALYSGIALLEQIANKHFAKKPEVLQKLYAHENDLSFSEIVKSLLPSYLNAWIPLPEGDEDKLPSRHKSLELFLKSHYFTEMDGTSQDRLRKITDIFKKNKCPDETQPGYFETLAYGSEALKRESGIYGSSKKEIARLGRYLHTNRNQLSTKHPELYRDISFCMAYSSSARNITEYTSERYFSYGYYSKAIDGTHEKNWKKISYSDWGDETYCYDGNRYFPWHPSARLLEKTHSITDKSIREDFAVDSEKPKLTANNIQIKIHAKEIDKKIDLRRILSQIGVCAESQIVATIEYLQANVTNIESKDVQQVLFMLLFDKGLLGHEIKENPKGILSLLNIIESGTQFYSLNELKQPANFYLKLNTFLRKTLVSLPRNTPHYDQILAKTEALSQKLAAHQVGLETKKKRTDFQSSLLSELQALRIIELANVLQLQGKLNAAELTEFYKLNFTMRFAKELVPNSFLNKEVNYALHQISAYSSTHPELTTKEMATEVAKHLSVRFNVKKAKFLFPEIATNSTKINLIEAEIFQKGSKYSLIHKELYENGILNELFGSKVIIAKKQQIGYKRYTYQFEQEGCRYQLQNDYYHGFIIQKEVLNDNNQLEWYQLKFPVSAAIQGILPLSFTSKENNWVWQSKDGNLIVNDKKSNLLTLNYSPKTGVATLFDQTGKKAKHLLSRELLANEFSFLKHFESSPENIEISEDLTTKAIHIKFLRYGLNFTSKKIHGKTYFVDDEDQETCLVKTPQLSVLGNNVGLTLASVPQKGKPSKILKTLVAKFPEHNTNKGYYATYFHVGTEFEPASAADAYYLAHKYLETSNPEKGYELLSKYAHRFLGTPQELESLGRIFYEKKGSIIGCAIGALACSTIVQYLRQGNTINDLIDKLKESNGVTRTDTIKKHLEQMKKIAADVLKEYLVMKDYIPKSMRLKKSEELAILRYVKQDKPNFYLDIQTKKSALKIALKEYHSLMKLNPKPSGVVAERLKVLKDKLLKEYSYIPNQDQLIAKSYDLTKRSSSGSRYSYDENDNLSSKKTKTPSITIDELKLDIDLKHVEKNYLSLFKEAAAHPKKEAALHEFLNKKMIAIAHKNRSTKVLEASEIQSDEAQKLNIPDTLVEIFNTLFAGLKFPVPFEFPREAASLALLKGMIANKEKVFDIIRKFEDTSNSHRWHSVTNGAGESSSFGNVKSAIEFAFSNQTIKFDISTKNEQPGKPTNIRFMQNIKEKSYFQDDAIATLTIANLDSVLDTLGLKEKLNSGLVKSNVSSTPVFSSPKSQDPFYESLFAESNQDYAKGHSDNVNYAALTEGWRKVLGPIATRKSIQAAALDALNKNEKSHQQLHQDIIKLLNQGPKDQNQQLQWQLALHAKTRKELTIEDAFKHFSNGCLTNIQEALRLDEPEAKQLIRLTQQYLLEGTQRQQYQRILDHLTKLQTPKLSADETSTLLNQLGTELTLKHSYDVKKNPDILLFEYQENKLVYPNQIRMIEKLSEQKVDGSYKSIAVPLIMGGGKSKVLLPLLAKKRANGTNLCIIEVPGSLLETNYYDLHATSAKIHQKAHLFKFKRELNTDSSYFYRLRSHLQSVKANKEYIVTTRESIQSLELKYVEILTNPEENLEEWEKKTKYLDDITNLIKDKGDALLDEIDLNLRTKDQLIYTVGSGKPTTKYVIEAIVKLYQSFAHINCTIKGKVVNLHDIVTLKSDKPSEEDLKVMIQMLRSHLMTSSQSPIAEILKPLKDNEKKQVEDFLSNNYTKIPDCINAMSLQYKSTLAVYKEHLHRLLPLSLSRKLYENFGLSQDVKKQGMEREIAIPYISNNTPNESAKFQNPLLTINYTIQTHYAQSLSMHVFELMLKDFKQKSLAESNLNAYAKNPTNRVETLFKSFFGTAIDLRTLDLNNQEALGQYHHQFKNSLALKDYCLNEFILPSILSNPLTLGSNDQNHVSQYRGVVGFTGTPYNHRCFHQSIGLDNSESFGTDGQTISHLLRKERKTHILTDNSPDALFDLLKKHQDIKNVRAIIDSGAQFKGKTNREVANKLAKIYFEKPECDIKHILYFNQENVLCALKVTKNPEHEKPFVLGSSENIAGKLGCDAKQYCSYYDQAHTTGTDIKQAPNTVGIATISEKVLLRDAKQGVMRLRDLKGSHDIEFAVMNSLVKEQPTIQNWDVKTILNICLQYEAKTLMGEHLSAAYNKISNAVRNNVMSQIRTAESKMDKIILSDAYKQMLYQLDDATYFDKYGMPETMVETEALLKIAQDRAIEKWKSCLQNANRTVDSKELKVITDEIGKVIQDSVKICAQKQLSALHHNSENQVISQIEVQKEAQKEVETETESQDAGYKERSYKSWATVNLETYQPGKVSFMDRVDIRRTNIELMNMEQIADSHRVPRNWKFDTQLLVSENFYNTCKNPPSDKLDRFKKPLFYVMSVQEGATLSKVLITQKEAQELREKLKNTKLPNTRHIWIETPSSIPYAGNKPSTKHKEEDRLIEQIQFFNADVVYLTANYSSLTWFKEQAEDKLNYLQNELLTLHPSKAASVALLKEIMLQDDKLKRLGVQNESNLLTDKSWQRLHDAYMYPTTDKHYPKHTSAEYAKLQSYARHRDNIGFFSIFAKLKHYKNAAWSYLTRTLTSVLKRVFQFILLNVELSTIDYFKSKQTRMIYYAMFNTIVNVASWGLWLFGFSVANYIYYGITLPFRLYVARNAVCAYSRFQYNSITKIEKASANEAYALQFGVDSSSSTLSYLKSLFSPTCYLNAKAYYAGLDIGSSTIDGVLKDEIKRRKLK